LWHARIPANGKSSSPARRLAGCRRYPAGRQAAAPRPSADSVIAASGAIVSDGTVSQEAIARGIRIRQTQEGARADMHTRMLLVANERGLTEKQLTKYLVCARKNSKPRFDHWRFAEDQGISPDWLFEGDLRSHPRGKAVQP
jgi:hypothetical protein